MTINVADLPAVRAQLERDAGADVEPTPREDVAGTVAAEVAQARPSRCMVLDRGRYYVIENEK